MWAYIYIYACGSQRVKICVAPILKLIVWVFPTTIQNLYAGMVQSLVSELSKRDTIRGNKWKTERDTIRGNKWKPEIYFNWRYILIGEQEASETLSGVTQSRVHYIYMGYTTSISARASNYVKWVELSVSHF